MYVNLSNYTKIKVESINDHIYLILFDIITATIRKNFFKKLIRKKLKI